MTTPCAPKYPVLVPGVGPMPTCGMIIGEAPGENERAQGIPFSPDGDAGRRLDEALDLAGASRHDFFVTNLFKGDVERSNRNPYQREIRDHRPLLVQELIAVQPKAILLVGAVPSADFLPHCHPLDVWAAKTVRIGNISWFPSWHPANRDPKKRGPGFQAAVKAFVDHCISQA